MIIEGTYKETITETEKIISYSTICPSGTRAEVTVIRPILTPEEYERRLEGVKRALEKFAKSVIADGFDWKERVRLVEEKRAKQNNDKI